MVRYCLPSVQSLLYRGLMIREINMQHEVIMVHVETEIGTCGGDDMAMH